MAIQRAGKLLKGLRIHHLGFGFFWAVTFVAISGFHGNPSQLGLWNLYSAAYQLTLPLCIGVLGVVFGLRGRELPGWWAGIASSMLGGAMFLYYLVFRFNVGGTAECLAAGILLGSASGVFFLMWELFYVTEGEQRAVVCIPLSAAMSVGIYLVLSLLPETLSMFCTVMVLPLLGLLTLQRSLGEIEMYEPRRLSWPDARRAIGDLWQPVVCVCALAFTWKLVTRLSTGGAEWYTWAALLGFVAASLLVVALELFLSRGFNVMRIYQVLFPLLTIAFLLPLLFGEHYTSLLVSMANFGFETINLLLIITCAVYTTRRELPSTPLYALCIGPTLLSMTIGSQTAALVGPAAAGDIAHTTSILVVCLVLLAAVMAAVGSGKDRAPASLSEDEVMSLPRRLHPANGKGRKQEAEQSAQNYGPGPFVQKPSLENRDAPVSESAGADGSVYAAALATASTRIAAGKSEAETDIASPTKDRSGAVTGDHPEPATPDARQPIEDYLGERGLSLREIEVAELLMRGNRVSAIASRLYISENTVRGHAKNIYRKLDVHNRQELIDLGASLEQP